MPKDNRNRKTQLALALAGGDAVTDWARKNDVSDRTAYRWAGSLEVRHEVAAIRQAALDRAIGRLSGKATAAAEQIARLAEEAASEAVRLQAARAVLGELMTVAIYATLEGRLDEVERRLAGSHRSPADDPRHDPTGGGPPGVEDRSCPAS